MSMKFNRVKAMSVMAAAAAAIALTACGNSGTISSLTDSDSTASIAEGAAVEQPAVLSASISAAESAVSSVPEIVPQTVAATEVTSAPAADLTAAAPDEEVSGTGNTDNAAAPLTSTAATAASTASEAESEAELLADNAEPTAAPEESTYEPAGEGNTGYITGDEVNVRETPTTDDGDDNVLFTLFEGDEVRILESADGWYKVEVDGETGWVNASFVE